MRDEYNFKGWETEINDKFLIFTKGNIEIKFDIYKRIYIVSTTHKNLAVPINAEIHYIIDIVMTDFEWSKDFYLPPND